MYQENSPRPRRLHPLAERRKLARNRVAPYLPDLKRWRSKSLQLRALHNSRHQSPEALAEADVQLAALKREIEEVRTIFLKDMDDVRDTPAVVDYVAALDSLLKG
jgi:hypothetical protein